MKNITFNLIICGALTSKPYAFKGRPWELKGTKTIDFFDGFGSSIQIETKGSTIYRVIPVLNNELNQDWISDKVRFNYDAHLKQRLDFPLKNNKGRFVEISWKEFLSTIIIQWQKDLPQPQITGLFGDFAEGKSLVYFKDLMHRLGGEVYLGESFIPRIDLRQFYYFTNNSLNNIRNLILCGADPRYQAPILNIRLRNLVLYNKIKVLVFGNVSNLTYSTINLGNSIKTFHKFLKGRHKINKEINLLDSSHFLLGENVIQREDSLSWQNSCSNYGSVSFLSTAASRLISFELGCLSFKNSFKSMFGWLYLYDCDEVDSSWNNYKFIIYQGHHGDRIINTNLKVNWILPGCTPWEKESLYVNVQSQVQHSKFIITPPGEARNDWRIFDVLDSVFNDLYSTKESKIKTYKQRLLELCPSLLKLNIIFNENSFILKSKSYTSYTYPVAVDEEVYVFNNKILTTSVIDFYLNDNISRSSINMILASSRNCTFKNNFNFCI